jgi:hypothetical protein
VFARTYFIGIYEQTNNAPLTNQQHIISQASLYGIVGLSIVFMLLDVGYTDSFYKKAYIPKRISAYRTITIIVELWMLVVLLVSTLLISFSMVKLKVALDQYNSLQAYRDRITLRKSATILHLSLLIIMLTSGIIQLSLVIDKNDDETTNELAFRLGTGEVILSSLINCIICFVLWTLTSNIKVVVRRTVDNLSGTIVSTNSDGSEEQSNQSLATILNEDAQFLLGPISNYRK